MRGFLIIVLIILITALIFSIADSNRENNLPQKVSNTTTQNNSTTNNSSSATDCDPQIWKYVYHTNRFTVYDNCKTVSGTVKAIHNEKDGDVHIQLYLDSGSSDLVNSKNISSQNGCLVLEIICAKKITQADAIEPCTGYYNNVTVPNSGDRITVTGTYVLDKQHGWNEIHPVSSIQIIGKGNPSSNDKNPVIGKTNSGSDIYQGPRGGHYHYSKSGNKIYEKKKK